MVIGKETTNYRLRLDNLVYILNSISNQVSKSIGIQEWDNLRIYLKKKESNIVQTQKNIENISIKSNKQFYDDLAFPKNKRIYRR